MAKAKTGRKKTNWWDWNDEAYDWRPVLKFKYHGHRDPTADEAIRNVECETLGIDALEERYPTIFAVARKEEYTTEQLVQERAALKWQARAHALTQQ